MKFDQFLTLNENVYSVEAKVNEFTVTFIDEDADEASAKKEINTCMNSLADLGVMVHGTDDKGGQRSYSKITIDTSIIDGMADVAKAMQKVLKASDNKVAFEGSIKYDGESLNITFDVNDDYVTAITHFKS